MGIDWAGLLGLLGPVAITVALVVMGLLSKRFGSVTRTPRYYVGFFVAAGLMAVSILGRLLTIGRGQSTTMELNHDPIWVFLYIGLPAVALTLSIVIAWRYWSWLLAERG